MRQRRGRLAGPEGGGAGRVSGVSGAPGDSAGSPSRESVIRRRPRNDGRLRLLRGYFYVHRSILERQSRGSVIRSGRFLPGPCPKVGSGARASGALEPDRGFRNFAEELPLWMQTPATIGREIAERNGTPRKARCTAYDLTWIASAA